MTNCVATVTGGALFRGHAAGTEFADCRCSGTGGQVCDDVYAEFCSFRCQGDTLTPAFANGGTFVNCTVVGYRAGVFDGSAYRLYNSLVFGNENASGAADNGTTGEALWVTNSLLGISHSVNVGAGSEADVDASRVRLVAAAAGDFRLADASKARAVGDAAWLTLASYPTGCVRRDVYGHPVTVETGRIAAGCSVVDFPRQTHGCIGVASKMQVRELGGAVLCSGDCLTPIGDSYAFTLRPVQQTPAVHHLEDVRQEGKRTYPIQGGDGWFPVAAQSDIDADRMFAAMPATQVVYVDAEHGSDSWDGSSSNFVAGVKGPKKTLTGAIAVVGAGERAIVYALPGVYDDGTDGVRARSSGVTDESKWGVRYRAHVSTTTSNGVKGSVGLVAVAGPEKTFIVGAPDPTTGGVGPDAIGGVWLESGSHFVQGFSILGCYGPTTVGKWQQSGAAFNGGGSWNTHVLDCVLSNNVAIQGSATCYGTILRCRILDNLSARYTTEDSNCGACIFAGNQNTNTSVKTSDHVIAYCSVNGTEAGAFGCTFDGKGYGDYPVVNGSGKDVASLAVRCTGQQRTTFCVVDASQVADADGRDYRLGTLSPAVGFAPLSSLSAVARLALTTDVYGKPLEFAKGALTAGAVHDLSQRVACYAVVGSGGSVVGGAQTNFVVGTGPITAVAETTRPFLRFDVNGEACPSGQTTVSFVPSSARGAATVVTAVFGTNWYVNASVDTDAGLGSTPETARKTIRSATAHAVAGDVIHVARGTYGVAEGANTVGSQLLPNRVVVPAGVVLEATDGPDETCIVGHASARSEAVSGNGPDAVRCVYCGAGARLRRFTVTGGHTLQAIGTAESTADHRGGALFAADPTVRFEDCIISNNAACEGTVFGGTVIRSGVFGNVASRPLREDGNPQPAGAAGMSCSWYGCVIDGNCGNATLYDSKNIESCTLGEGNHCLKASERRFAQVVYGTNDCRMVNTVILGSENTTYGKRLFATNCLFRTGIDTVGWNTSPYAGNRGDCIMTDVAHIRVWDDYCPAYGAFAGIDRGDISLSDGTLPLDADLTGRPRVQNGTMDIGAVEYDWRTRYSAVLGRRATVTFASPDVLEDGAVVRILSGMVAGRVLTCAAEAKFSVVGGGTLSVYLGDELVGAYTAAAVPSGVRLSAGRAGAAFRFVFTPDPLNPGGYAEIGRFEGVGVSALIVK